jgi:hypothetical protein
MISEVEIGKVYVLPSGLLVTAYSFQDYAGIGRCVFLELTNGIRVPFAEVWALQTLVDIDVEIESAEQG